LSRPAKISVRKTNRRRIELLDWLAVEFMEAGRQVSCMGIKHLHRLIVMSNTYRQSSR
jgi:hypothetical protein